MFSLTYLIILGLSSVGTQDSSDTLDICSAGEWRCADSACIPAAGRCNGSVECADSSDEAFHTCRTNRCSEGAFRCAYGGCVNGTAACNKLQECRDNSDEALTRCLPETDRIQCDTTRSSDGQYILTCFNRTDCENGQLLDLSDRCDGKVDCSDGSDENLDRCTEVQCGEDRFRCAYGGCAHGYAQCNGIVDCADGSDESDDLCGRTPTTVSPIEATSAKSKPQFDSQCVLPPYPDNGTYTVAGDPGSTPGVNVSQAYLNFTCTTPYKIVGKNLLYCYRGIWSDEFPSCKLYCELNKHISVEYRCQVSGRRSLQGWRACGSSEPSGAAARPLCRSPNYYYPGVLPLMRCVDGNWDYIATCVPECGRITPLGTKLVAGGRQAERDELPWHVAVFAKTPHRQICGGTVLTNTVVLSAAHCFWDDTGKMPASNYAVAAAKLNREWDHPDDTYSQKSDVLEIIVPDRYQGVTASYQDDIALVRLSSALQYSVRVRPACLDIDHEFDSRQLQAGNKGTVAGWGLTSEEGGPSPTLKVVELPYVTVTQCLEEVPYEFRSYVTSDKICAGYKNGTAVCRGDSGGGLTFPEVERGAARHYVRGVVSAAPRGLAACNTRSVATFTRVVAHRHFIARHIGQTTYSATGQTSQQRPSRS